MFPPRLKGFRGRSSELRTLVAACAREPHPKVALVGPGGTGKSALACALGHTLRAAHPGGIEWFRVGVWDHQTLLDMLSIRLGVPFGSAHDSAVRLRALRSALERRAGTLIVLDNHENDRALARFLNALAGTPVTWIITARRCLLGGVSVFPVIAPLVSAGRSPWPAVAPLTRLLRWNPLALGLSDALISSGATTVEALKTWLIEAGIDRVHVIAHEDDLPEVRLLIAWAWPRLPAAARRLLGVLAHLEGDHADAASLVKLSRAGSQGKRALAALQRWHLVQEPLPGRFAVHATVRAAVAHRVRFDQTRAVAHYLRLLERHPQRLDLEQTHLFAAMDHAHSASELKLALRIDQLLVRLGLA